MCRRPALERQTAAHYPDSGWLPFCYRSPSQAKVPHLLHVQPLWSLLFLKIRSRLRQAQGKVQRGCQRKLD
ncbi:hypothetical protein ARTHRO9AX_10290 [Arthrobacter sp. 9AX]|nr:hypothetical protein ARTHRO9AX_10290 [Arthrobacter sp. 9AX]